jgi:hypothetical protein
MPIAFDQQRLGEAPARATLVTDVCLADWRNDGPLARVPRPYGDGAARSELAAAFQRY